MRGKAMASGHLSRCASTTIGIDARYLLHARGLCCAKSAKPATCDARTNQFTRIFSLAWSNATNG